MRPGRNSKPLLEYDIKSAQSQSKSEAQAARLLGVNFRTYKKYADLYGLYGKCLNPTAKGIKKKKNHNKGIRPLEKILNNEYPNISPKLVMDKLIKTGTKEQKCEMCDYDESRISDGRFPLILNFLDGNRKNYSIDNLKIYCYNCTHNYGQGTVFGRKKIFSDSELNDS